MAAVSVAYVAFHRYTAPEQQAETYRMFFDLGMFETLGRYTAWSAGAHTYADYRSLPIWPYCVAEGLVLGSLGAFAARMMWLRRWLAAFLVGWFVIVLAPVLPLRNHVTDYYLTIPVIGLAMLGAWGLSVALRSGRGLAAAGVLLVIIYAAPSVWAGRSLHRDYYDVSQRTRTFIASVAYAHRLHPGKTLLIDKVDSELFWSAWHDRPFRLFGGREIYLTPGSAASIEPKPREGFGRSVLPETLALEGLKRGKVVVYEVIEGDRLRNTTFLARARLARTAQLQLPAFLEAGAALSSVHLGEGWWPLDAHFRWTARRASLRLRGPLRRGGTLIIRGFCSEQHMAQGPLHVIASVDGHPYPAVQIDHSNLEFRLVFPLPDSTVRKSAIDIAIEVDRTLQPPNDPRHLGLAFGTFEVVP
jgi:hypothetical protein